ncbi:hypothetical protein L1887_18274 [Cichorium endivia]|nr:hypothetical protein L1887_18274 [Cichorium endivia]
MWTVLPLVDFGWAISYFNPPGWAILSWKAFWQDVGLYFFTSHWAPSWRGLFLGWLPITRTSTLRIRSLTRIITGYSTSIKTLDSYLGDVDLE